MTFLRHPTPREPMTQAASAGGIGGFRKVCSDSAAGRESDPAPVAWRHAC
jgi:hypothetical protein